MKKTFIIFSFVFGVAQPASSQVRRIDELVEAARQNNPSVQAFEARVKASGFVKDQALSWNDPVLMLEFDKVTPKHDHVGEVMLGVSQDVPLTNVRTLAGKASERETAALKMDEQGFQKMLVRDVKVLAYQLFLNAQKQSLAEEMKQIASGFTKINLTKTEVGQGSQTEVLKSQVEVSRTINELFRLNAERRVLLKKISLLAGVAVTNVSVSESELLSLSPLHGEDSLKTLALAANTDLQAMQERIASQQLTHEAAGKAGVPNLTLGAAYRYMPSEKSGEFKYDIGINLPLFGYSTAKNDARFRETQSTLTAMERDYAAKKLAVETSLAETLSDIGTADETITFYKQVLIPQTESTFKSASVAYQTGKVDFLTLLDAYRAVRETKTIYAETLTQRASVRAELARFLNE
jgi:cobalt-zinc-cadmium efflux system outer membrane protein